MTVSWFRSADRDTSDVAAESDAVGDLIATSCNAGSPIYAATWWKVAPASPTTFTAHTGRMVGGIVLYEPIGTAVVSADLSTVASCGIDFGSITQTGPFVASAAEPLFIVTFERTQPIESFVGPALAVFPSTGVAPVNDLPSSPTVVPQLPFSAIEDTTLATVESAGLGCYSIYGSRTVGLVRISRGEDWDHRRDRQWLRHGARRLSAGRRRARRSDL